MSGERPADPYTHWRRRAETAEAEVARLNMEMEAYRQPLTAKDSAAMLSVIDALQAEKATRQLKQATWFDRFIANLDELLADQPHKMVGEAEIGRWGAIHCIRNAAWVAKCAAEAEEGQTRG